MVGLGRWFRRTDQPERGLELFRKALAAGLPDDLLFRTMWDIAALEKKLGREHAALPVLTDLAACPNSFRISAYQELAKYYEHREKNPLMALEMTRCALALDDRDELRKRAARLEKRANAPKTKRLL
jgi:hypothetical protein